MHMATTPVLSRRPSWVFKVLGIVTFLAASLMAGGSAHAQLSNASCRFNSSGFNLGTYDPDNDNDSMQAIDFTCEANFAWEPSGSVTVTHAAFRLCLYMGEDAGTQPGHNPWRYMTNNNVTGTGTAYLAYNLYADAARTQILFPEGLGTPLVQDFILSRPGNTTYVSASGQINVHGRIPAGQSGLPANPYYSYNPLFTLISSAAAGSTPPSDCMQSSTRTAGQIQLTGRVIDSCSLSTEAVDFGTISEIGNVSTALNADGEITVQCSTGTTYTVYLGEGNYSAGGGQRQMANGASRLRYQLFQDGARTLVWNDSNGVLKTATGSNQTLPVYGRIAQGTPVPGAAGAYSDTVIVTVSY